jgi:hypothetical protein
LETCRPWEDFHWIPWPGFCLGPIDRPHPQGKGDRLTPFPKTPVEGLSGPRQVGLHN